MPGVMSLAKDHACMLLLQHLPFFPSPSFFFPPAHLTGRTEDILQWPLGQMITFRLGICLLNICHVLASVRTGNTNTEAICCRGKGAGPEGSLGWLSLALTDVCFSLLTYHMLKISFNCST